MLTRDARGAAVLAGIRLGDLLRAPAGDPASPLSPTDDSPASGVSAGGIRTPAYFYDVGGMVEAAREIGRGFGPRPHLVAYAVKANSAGPIMRALARAGCGAEVVSGGELALALACGFSPERILYSGVGKTDVEIDRAIAAGDRGILAIQLESVEEIARVERRARSLGRRARVSVRVNPGIEADTHAHVATGHDDAKFGIAQVDLPRAWAALDAASSIDVVGLSYHVGSQLLRTDEYLAAADALLRVAAWHEAHRGRLGFLDFGGGFGIDYGGQPATPPADFARAIAARLAQTDLASRLAIVEPGRSIVAAHGVLCAGVVTAKRSQERRWLVLDAGMNDLVRPALYGARHRIEPLDDAPCDPDGPAPSWRVAGPVCESSDDFGDHRFEEPPPERVVIRDAGAYGYVMASEYNGRALPTEVFLQSGDVLAVSALRRVEDWVAERAAIGPA